MAMLAEVVDAVVGTDTNRDTHQLEIAHPTGASIDTRSISNDTAGYAQAGPGAPSTPPAHGWWSRSRAPAATAPG